MHWSMMYARLEFYLGLDLPGLCMLPLRRKRSKLGHYRDTLEVEGECIRVTEGVKGSDVR